MLNFIFGLTPDNSAFFIGWCLLFVLSIPLAVKAKNKYFTVLVCFFMFFAALKAAELIFDTKISAFFASIPYIKQIVLFALGAFDTLIALLLLFAKPKLRSVVFIPFIVSNVIITLAFNIAPLTDLFLTNGSLFNIFDIVSSCAVYAKVGLTLIFFILLLIFKYGKPNEIDKTAATETAQSQTQEQQATESVENTLLHEETQNNAATVSQSSLQVESSGLPKMYCKSCGYSCQTDKTICPSCFNEMTVLKQCPNCRNMTSGNYCGRCGTKVN